MSSHTLFNLRTKRNLEINELTELINKNMVHIMNPINYGNGKIINTNLSLKDAMILADFFDTPYQMLVESKYKEYQQQIDDIDIRL